MFTAKHYVESIISNGRILYNCIILHIYIVYNSIFTLFHISFDSNFSVLISTSGIIIL